MGKGNSKQNRGRSKGFIIALVVLLILVAVDYGFNGSEGSLVQAAKMYLMEYDVKNASVEENTSVAETTDETYTSSQLEAYFFDVGQADSILLLTDGKAILVDTGNAGDAALDDKVKDKINLTHELKRLGVEKFDLVLTHPHEDHMGSSYKIIQMFDIGNLYVNALLQEDEQAGYYERFVKALEEKNVQMVSPTTLTEEEIKAEIEAYNVELMAEYQAQKEELIKSGASEEELNAIPEPELVEYNVEDYIRVGDTIPFGNAKITMLAPNSAEYSDTNDYSIVLMVEFEGVKMLLTGDAGEKSEEEILQYAENQNFDLNCDILKVGHHGSRTASTEEFISAVDPEYAVIMVAEENSYGLPDEDVLERLEKQDTIIYQTKDKGDIHLVINDGEYQFDFDYAYEVKENGEKK